MYYYENIESYQRGIIQDNRSLDNRKSVYHRHNGFRTGCFQICVQILNSMVSRTDYIYDDVAGFFRL